MIRLVFRGAQLFVDLLVLSLAYWLAFLFRFEFRLRLEELKLLAFTWPYVVALKYVVFVAFGVPNLAWRYVNIRDTRKILTALAVATAILTAFRLTLASRGWYFNYLSLPLGVLAMDFVLAFLGAAGVRVLRRMLAERGERAERLVGAPETHRTLIIGAGRAGVLVAREVAQNPRLGIDLVGFVDDDRMKIGTVIEGYKVLGGSDSLAALAREHRAEQAIIAIASATGETIRTIVRLCEQVPLPVKIVPGIQELLQGKTGITRIREVTIEDLLGREAVELDLGAIAQFLSGKRVLVTGAGGSIGSELCRQVARFHPARLILVEQAENALFLIHQELGREKLPFEVVPAVADVCDSKRLERIFSTYKPEVVFHAAAHKHVPMMEWNPGEAVKNNVFGTRKVADAADRHGASAFVMISTDKAVNPSSIMGLTKRIAELYVQAVARKSKTKYVTVRFGNVLGSAGSVIPIFKAQIERGGPVTVTHPEMRRYFMTIPEACQLVMEAAAMGQGGEIFVLDMGQPVKILDLARDLIRLSGFSESEIKIEFSGIRPGEKLFEELSTSAEHMDKTRHPKIFVGKHPGRPLEDVVGVLDMLSGVTDMGGRNEILAAVRELVPEARASDAELVAAVEGRSGEKVSV